MDAVDLARDIRAGVIPVENNWVVIAMGNSAEFNRFTNMAGVSMSLVHALIERFGCITVQVWVSSISPRPLADPQEVDFIKKQNKAIFRSVRAVVRKKKYLVCYLSCHKWLLKRVKNPEQPEKISVKVDNIYYHDGTNVLNEQGLVHLHLLMA